MDEKAVEAAGIKPMHPYLEAIEGLSTKSGLARLAADAAYTSGSPWSDGR
jgi:predicted metalloendopeptidase